MKSRFSHSLVAENCRLVILVDDGLFLSDIITESDVYIDIGL